MKALIFLLALLALGTSAWAVVPVMGRPAGGTPMVQQVSFNGRNVLDAPRFRDVYKFLVSLRIEKPGHTFNCGGALIDSQIILTAAHCVDGATAISAVFFSYDANMKLRYEMKPTRGYRVPENWHLGFLGRSHPPEIGNRQLDYALVRIDDIPSYAQPIALAPENTKITKPTVYAFGLDTLPPSTAGHTGPRLAAVSIRGSTLNPGTTVYTGGIPQMNPPKRTAICGGDSGSPIVMVENDQLLLVGVTKSKVLVDDSLLDPSDPSVGTLKSRYCGDFVKYHNISMRYAELALLQAELLKIPALKPRK